MSLVHPERFALSMQLLDAWIKQAVYHEGWIKVTALNGWYIIVDKGEYYVHKYGHTKRWHTSTKEILVRNVSKLITRTGGFEHRGYRYNFSMGEWKRYRLDDQR